MMLGVAIAAGVLGFVTPLRAQDQVAGAVALAGNHPADADLADLVPAAPDRKLDLQIVFGLRNRAALDQLLAGQEAAAPRSRRLISRTQFASRFGPRSSDFAEVQRWLEAQGFKLVSANRAARQVRCRGTVSQAQRAFGVAIVASRDGRLYANSSDPLIPERFAGVITYIQGLDDLHAAKALIRHFPALRGSPESMPDAPEAIVDGQGPAFAPQDLYAFYDELPILSSGNDGANYDCIALIEDSDFLGSAVSAFDSQFDLNSAAITKVFVNATNPGANGDEIEALLDIEWAHAVAPGAPLRVYIADPANSSPSGPEVDAIQRAVSDNACGVMSVSFSLCGLPPSFYTETVDPIYVEAVAVNGQTVMISSGDQGAAGLVFDIRSQMCVTAVNDTVNELSADPNVTSVGGTQFTPTYDQFGNNVGFAPESAWNIGGGASGGGFSGAFIKPAYQIGVTPDDGARDVPDVAMIAGPPGVFLYVDNDGGAALQCCFGGTSLSAPIWAAIQALIGGRQGNLNPSFYAANGPPGARDVINGNNGFNGVAGFSAAPGYDQTTGFGTLDIAQFVQARSPGVTPTPTAAPTPTSALPTSTPTATATVIPTPPPSAGGVVSVQSNGGSGGLGQSVPAGSFSVLNTAPFSEVITAVNVSFSQPQVFFSATLTGTSPDSTGLASASATPPSATKSFILSQPLVVNSGDSASFNLTVTLAISVALSVPGEPGPIAYAAVISAPAAIMDRVGPGPGSSLLVIGMSLLVIGAATRRRAIALAMMALFVAVAAVGCQGGSSSSSSSSGIGPVASASRQTINQIKATANGSRVAFSGLPADLGDVSSQ
jgi:hypothetical protein